MERMVNKIAKILRVAGIVVIVVGVIYAVFIGVLTGRTGNAQLAPALGGMAAVSALALIAQYAVIGLLIIGFSELIELVHHIRDNTGGAPPPLGRPRQYEAGYERQFPYIPQDADERRQAPDDKITPP